MLIKKKKKEGSNEDILTNDCLIRCMPLVIYSIRLEPEQTYNLVRLENSLTHVSYVVHYAVTAYVLAGQFLIRQMGKNERGSSAFEAACEYLRRKKKELDNKKKELQKNKSNSNGNKKSSDIEVNQIQAIEKVEKWLSKVKEAKDAKDKKSEVSLDTFLKRARSHYDWF